MMLPDMCNALISDHNFICYDFFGNTPIFLYVDSADFSR